MTHFTERLQAGSAFRILKIWLYDNIREYNKLHECVASFNISRARRYNLSFWNIPIKLDEVIMQHRKCYLSRFVQRDSFAVLIKSTRALAGSLSLSLSLGLSDCRIFRREDNRKSRSVRSHRTAFHNSQPPFPLLSSFALFSPFQLLITRLNNVKINIFSSLLLRYFEFLLLGGSQPLDERSLEILVSLVRYIYIYIYTHVFFGETVIEEKRVRDRIKCEKL